MPLRIREWSQGARLAWCLQEGQAWLTSVENVLQSKLRMLRRQRVGPSVGCRGLPERAMANLNPEGWEEWTGQARGRGWEEDPPRRGDGSEQAQRQEAVRCV